MEKIINKFRSIFDDYDYHNHNITKLVSAVELLMQMMSLVDNRDNDYIKKISSFLNLVSSDIDSEILDIGMVEYIYATKIIPILEYFECKYYNIEVKSSVDIAKEMLEDQYVQIEAGVPRNVKAERKMFGKIKEVGMNLDKIYRDTAARCLNNNKERSERALRDLEKTSKTMSLFKMQESIVILEISSMIQGLAETLHECIINKSLTVPKDDILYMGFERLKSLEFS